MAKNKRSGRRGQAHKRQQQFLVGAVALAVVLVLGIFFIANRNTSEAAYYKRVTPTQLDSVVKGNEPVLVYFHSPT